MALPGGEQIETTETHPFFVEGRGWAQAGQLGIGTQILTRAGPGLEIAGIERRWQAARVYNFEVEGLHCYFVGTSGGGLCVHNACSPEQAQRTALFKWIQDEFERLPVRRPAAPYASAEEVDALLDIARDPAVDVDPDTIYFNEAQPKGHWTPVEGEPPVSHVSIGPAHVPTPPGYTPPAWVKIVP